MKIIEKILIAVIGLTLASLVGYFYSQNYKFGGFSNLQSYPCTISSVTPVTVGKDLSTRLMATSSRRSWARISQPLYATNTVQVVFNADSPATLGSGLSLSPASTTLGTTYLDFGLNTELTYTGSVTGIVNNGSTTVLVTQCVY